MPLYYFHVINGEETIRDEEGIDLANMDEVREEALQAARQIMAELVLTGKDLDNRRFEIEDDAGETMLIYPFKLALAD